MCKMLELYIPRWTDVLIYRGNVMTALFQNKYIPFGSHYPYTLYVYIEKITQYVFRYML